VLTLALLIVGLARPVAAQGNAHGTLLRTATGTNWEPTSSPRDAKHFALGAYSLMLHGFAALAYIAEGGTRGDQGTFATNAIMAALRRPVGRGELELRAMASVEASMGPRGYPLLLQTGESADGVTPLLDRQHPHDALMELSVRYAARVDESLTLFAYAAPVGEPAFGPVPFFHRASGRDLARAPISHHLQDATHVANGVVTIGLVSEGRVKIEASAFNGLEPDHRRWDFEPTRFDSYAVRVSANAGPDWTLQASVAQFNEPERLHPGIDAARVTTSITHNAPLADGNWQTSLVLGRSKSKRTLIPVAEARRRFSPPVLQHYIGLIAETGIPEDSLILLFPARTQAAVLLESAIERGPWTIAARSEWVEKAELFPPTDLRHSRIFGVARLDVGVLRTVVSTPLGAVRLGAAGGRAIVPDRLRAAYGRSPVSYHFLARLDIR
jgi:hypothetical protein